MVQGYIMQSSFFKTLILFFFVVFTHASAYAARDLPAEFKQILPRGRIAAITKPEFVPAAQAKILPDSWVLGVVIEGKARAYSLNLLNSHEVVNDQIGSTPFSAVW